MSHQDLAISFYKTAICTKNNCLRGLSHEEICRAVYSRLYYSLFHKYLEYDTDLANSKDRSKHQEVQRKISANHSAKTFQLYKKMLALRIWADYLTTPHSPPGATKTLTEKLEVLTLQVNRCIMQDSFE